MANNIKVLWINNDGSGYSDYVQVEYGITLSRFVAERGIDRPSNYKIRVNRAPATADQVLCEGDRVSCTPTKIEGAKRFIRRLVARLRG